MNLLAPRGYYLAMSAKFPSTMVPGERKMGLAGTSPQRRREDGGIALASDVQRDEEATDASLLADVAEGQRTALALLYERHRGSLFGFLVHMLPDRATAEEVLQDTLVAVWRGARSYRGEASVRAWVFGIARRQAHNRLRRRSLDLVPLDAIAAPADSGPSPEDEVMRRADARVIRRALSRLAPSHREVLVLFFLQDFNQAEISAALAIPLGTVKSRLSHAKRALAHELHTSGESDHD